MFLHWARGRFFCFFFGGGKSGLHAPSSPTDLEKFVSILFAKILPHSWYACVPGWSPSGNFWYFLFKLEPVLNMIVSQIKGVIILLLMLISTINLFISIITSFRVFCIFG